MNRFSAICLAGLPGLLAPPAGAVSQDRVIDRGELEVREAGRLVGREAFTIRETRGPDGGPRLRLVVAAWYPADAGAVTLSQTLDLDPDSLPRTLQLDALEDEPRRYLVSFGDRRITVRIVSQRGEAAREYPGGQRNLVADDSALALFAILPSVRDGRVRLFHPRSGRRTPASLTSHGEAARRFGGGRRTMHHFSLEMAEETLHLWYDAQGRLMAVDAPARAVVAERTAPPGR